MTHHLASGIIAIRENTVLLVRDKFGWSLPKGSTEKGETFLETAKRETNEETGLDIEVNNVAFITEYKTKEYGQYLQVYYSGSVSNWDELTLNDPDNDISEIKFVPFNEVSDYIKFRPWIIPIEDWLRERCLRYYSFDLDTDGFEI